MTQIEMILIEEAEYPSDTFADCYRGDGYTAFYFDRCKDLHEGNHAIIYPERITDLRKVLNEVREFYAVKQKGAAIFHPLADEYYHYFEENREIIESCGYEITLNDDYRFQTLTGENTIKRNGSLDIRLGWDDRIETDIILPSGEYWELESTKEFASRKDNFTFTGYVGEKAVVYSIIHKSRRFDCVRFDYILCAKDERGKGYGSELISFIADFCRENRFNNCFDWAGPSENIVRRAGFCDVFTARSGRINYVNR